MDNTTMLDGLTTQNDTTSILVTWLERTINPGGELNSTAQYVNITVPVETEDGIFLVSKGVLLAAMIILTCELFLSTLTNTTLILTIHHSPSLKSPPNAHLLNICAANLLLTLGMFFEASSMICSGYESCEVFVAVSGNIQLFIDVTAFVNYCIIFSAIGIYRCQTMRKPSMTLENRQIFICKTIFVGWLVSVFLGTYVTIMFRESQSTIAWNAFRKSLKLDIIKLMESLTFIQSMPLYLILITIAVNCFLICRCYYFVLKALVRSYSVCKNRVAPTKQDLSSAENVNSPQLAYQTTSIGLDVQPYQISRNSMDNVVVHYQRRTETLTIDEVYALEYPVQAQALIQARASQSTPEPRTNVPDFQENGTPRMGSGFTDISPGAELKRVQMMKNIRALQNQSWRRERVSLGSATKNGLVMMTTFVLCSSPLLLCSIPGVLPLDSAGRTHYILLFTQLMFNLNAPAYPIWYLIFSKRVRKCLQRLYENALIKMKIRQ